MKIKTLLLIFSLVFIFSCKTDNEKIKDSLYKKYMTESYPKSEGYMYSYSDESYSINHPDHEFTLGSVEIELYEDSLDDFNKDGIPDMWAKIFDAGLGGGGNAFEFSYGIVQIKSPTDIDYIGYFGFGKFSNYTYNIEEFKNKTPIVTVSTGYQGRLNQFPLSDIKAHLGFKDGELISLNYDDCAMAEMKNKNIFKKEYKTNYDFGLDGTFSERKLEFFEEDGFKYSFSINGCNDFIIEMRISGDANEVVLKEKLLNTGITKTRFKTLMERIKNKEIQFIDYFYNDDEVNCNECISAEFVENEDGKNNLKMTYIKRD